MMIKDFLLTYWKELVYGVIAIATLLVAIFRKKGRVDPVLDKILEAAPGVINHVENHYGAGNGALKKSMVMALLGKIYKKYTGYELCDQSELFHMISEYVEKILSTPERKKDEK